MKKRVLCALSALAAAGMTAALLSPRAPAGDGGERKELVMLGDYGGCVAVYCPEESALPRQVTPIEVRLLPGADREQLRRGIPVEDGRALAMLLEDLGS